MGEEELNPWTEILRDDVEPGDCRCSHDGDNGGFDTSECAIHEEEDWR